MAGKNPAGRISAQRFGNGDMPKILALTANPVDSTSLRLDEEIRHIKLRLESAPNFRFEHEGAARAADLLRLIERERPDILHFSGHGSLLKKRDFAVALEDESGQTRPVPARVLTQVFKQAAISTPLCLLNCCYSSVQAAAISRIVDVVVGARGELPDDLATLFSSILYEWLGHSRTIGDAFDIAKTQVVLSGANPNAFVIRGSPRTLKDLCFYGAPEILAEFRLNRAGNPVQADTDDEEYEIYLWIRGAEDYATSVVYEACDDSYDERYWEVGRVDDSQFKTYDFTSYGQLTIRAVVWSGDRGIGISSTLTEALARFYGPTPRRKIRETIEMLSRY